MRRRLLVLGLSAVILAIALVVIPFGIVQARYRVLSDRDRQAALASQIAVEASELLIGDLRTALSETARNRGSERVSVFVVDSSATIRTIAGTKVFADLAPDEQRRIQRVARGLVVSPAEDPILPNRPIVAIAPIQNGQQTIGAAVVVAESGALRSDILNSWGVLALRSAFIVLVSAVLALPLTRWTVRPLTDLAQAMRDVSSGAETTRVSAIRGPSEVRDVASSFNRMADETQIALQRQRSFVADASHQLRTPLTALRLRLDLLGMHISDEPHASRSLVDEHSRAVRDLDGMIQIVERLLELAQSERVLETVGQSPAEVVDERLTSWNLIANRTSVSVDARDVPNEFVIIQQGALGQILDVLVDNAIKFSPEGSLVTVSGLLTDDLVEIVVTNKRQSDDRAGGQGYGLGVAIATRLLATVGGTLSLDHGASESQASVRLLRFEP